jgi:hypothetical protein
VSLDGGIGNQFEISRGGNRLSTLDCFVRRCPKGSYGVIMYNIADPIRKHISVLVYKLFLLVLVVLALVFLLVEKPVVAIVISVGTLLYIAQRKYLTIKYLVV